MSNWRQITEIFLSYLRATRLSSPTVTPSKTEMVSEGTPSRSTDGNLILAKGRSTQRAQGCYRSILLRRGSLRFGARRPRMSDLRRESTVSRCDCRNVLRIGVSALESIAGNPSKAKYVKLLGIDFYNEARDVDTAVMENMLRAIPNMSNVEKICIRLDRHDLWDFAKDALSDALW